MKEQIIKIGWSIFRPESFFLIIAFLLIQLWFTKNLLFGGAEAGIPTYTPEKILNQIIWTWWETVGPGVSIPTVSASIPLYAVMAMLERLGLGAISIQKLLFFILIYLQGLGASLVFKMIFPSMSRLSPMAGLFYIFNPYMMSFIWHRFIYTNFIFSAVLPLLIYFYLQLLEKKRYRYFFYFLFASFFSSYMYSAIAPAMALWLAILLIYLTAIVINRVNLKELYKLTLISVLLFISWLATNLWWVYPLSQNRGIFNIFSTQSNVEALVTLSEKSALSNVLRGLNPYILFMEKDWGDIYTFIYFQIFSWIPLIFFLFGLITSVITRKRIIKMWYMITLFIFAVFFAKGTADPFGFINSWLYSHLFILGAIKNSFEKLGLLVFLPISMFTAVGVVNLWNLYRKHHQRILVSLAILACAVYVWPMWSDKLFNSDKYPLLFKLPDDYLNVSTFLSEEIEKDEGKILFLPITEGDSTTYLWSYLYNGTNLANHIFPGMSISRFSYVPSIDSILDDTARIFNGDNYSAYEQIIHALGVKFIVLNKDIDWYFRDVDNPKLIEAKLDKFNKLVVLKDTENLKVYKFTDKIKEKFVIPSKITAYSVAGESILSDLDFMWEGSDVGKRAYLEIAEDKISSNLIDQQVLLPKRVIIDRAEFRDSQDFIPPTYYEKYLPGSIFYPFVSIIEKIQTFLTPSYKKPLRVLLLTTKRLREVQRLHEQNKPWDFFASQNKERLFNDSIHAYSKHLDQALDLFYSLKDEKINDERLTLSEYILRQEKKDLENLLMHVKDEKIKKLIRDDLKKIDDFNKLKGFTLIYPIDDIPEFINKDNYSYQFSTRGKFKGNLIIAVSNLDYFGSLDNGNLFLFIDGNIQQASVKKIKNLNWFDLGEITLGSGQHEITVPISNDNNMITNLSQFKNIAGLIETDGTNLRVNTQAEGFWMEYKLSDYKPDEKYLVRFYHRVIKGCAPTVEILQDKDAFVSPYNDKKIKARDKVQSDPYDFDWRYFQTSFGKDVDATIKMARSTKQPVVRITVPIWNDYKSNNLKNPRICTNDEFIQEYGRPSIVELRDMKITKLVSAKLFLKSSQNSILAEESEIQYRKISPVEYQLEIDGLKNFFIVFNESYHQGWKAELSNGQQTELIGENSHFLANGYANGWFISEENLLSEGKNLFINQSGKINLKIKFIPQEYLYKGVIISFTASFLIIIFFISLLRK